MTKAAQIVELTAACDQGDEVACDNLSREEEAKQKWLASLDTPSWGKMSEEQAKRAWLAKLDVPTWGRAAAQVMEAAQIADMSAACDQGDHVACDNLSREEEAKKKWLSSLDLPTWGAAAAAMSAVAS